MTTVRFARPFSALPSVRDEEFGRHRPAPLGRKETCTVRLTPDAAEFCRQHPAGFPVLEEKLRKSKEFRDWLAGRQPRSK